MLDFLRDMLVLFWDDIPKLFWRSNPRENAEPLSATEEGIETVRADSAAENPTKEKSAPEAHPRKTTMRCPECAKALTFKAIRDWRCPHCHTEVAMSGLRSLVVKGLMLLATLTVLYLALQTKNFLLCLLALGVALGAQVLIATASLLLFPPKLQRGGASRLNLK